MVVSVTLRTRHHTGMEDISEVSLAHQDVNEVPVLGPRMHPGFLQAVCLLEYGVGEYNLLLCTDF